jgi:hypothetical protein
MPSPESLSPQLSSVESLRSSLPEKYRHLFDSLLQDIKDYCASHDLPFHLLSSPEAFTKAVGPIRPSLLEPLKLRMERLAHLIKHKEPMPEEPLFLTQEQAREIMGRNFLGTKEVEEHFGELSLEQEEALSIIPFSKETLEECKDTHILVADIGISIVDIGKLESCKGLLYTDDWFETEVFAKYTEQPSWRLVRKTPVENSLNKTWEEQQALLDPKTEETPLLRQVIYTTIFHFLVTGERLFKTLCVRIHDIDSEDGDHIGVGFFGKGSLYVNYSFDDVRYGNTGISSARKLQNPSSLLGA